MDVIRGRNGYGIYVISHLHQHLTEVLVERCLGEGFSGLGCHFHIDVTEGDDSILTFVVTVDYVAVTLATTSYGRQFELITGSGVALASQDMSRYDEESSQR